MSGAEFIQLEKSLVEKQFLEDSFWKKKLINLDATRYTEILERANNLLQPHLKKPHEGIDFVEFHFVR